MCYSGFPHYGCPGIGRSMNKTQGNFAALPSASPYLPIIQQSQVAFNNAGSALLWIALVGQRSRSLASASKLRGFSLKPASFLCSELR